MSNETWICKDCGNKYGKYSAGLSTWHNGKCDYCGKETAITETRDFGYPKKAMTMERYSKKQRKYYE